MRECKCLTPWVEKPLVFELKIFLFVFCLVFMIYVFYVLMLLIVAYILFAFFLSLFYVIMFGAPELWWRGALANLRI